MAIESVLENWKGRSLNAGTDNIDVVRIFDVIFDGTGDPGRRLQDAYSAVDPSTGVSVPAKYSRHPNNSVLFVQNKRVEPANGPMHYRVYVTYGTRAVAGYETGMDPMTEPLAQPWQIRWGTAREVVPIDRDIYGGLITNSALETFDPPPTDPVHDLTLNIVRNQGAYNAVAMHQYIDAVNNDIFWGFAPGIVLCLDISADSQIAADMMYWRVQFSFQMRFEGWQLKLADMGMREYTNIDDDGKPVFQVITDSNGTPVSQPVALDGSGGKLTVGADPVFRYFDVKRSLPFSGLGL